VRLPVQADTRREAHLELARQCSADRPDRKPYHAELREWYTRGTNTGQRARYNKLQSHVRQSAAYLFQSESVRVEGKLPPRYGDQFNAQIDTYRDEVYRWFHDTRAALTIPPRPR
jgi:hypothetical protein